MRLSEALHFYFGDGDLTKSHKKVQYTHFCPSDADYALKAKLARMRDKMRSAPPAKELVDLFD